MPCNMVSEPSDFAKSEDLEPHDEFKRKKASKHDAESSTRLGFHVPYGGSNDDTSALTRWKKGKAPLDQPS